MLTAFFEGVLCGFILAIVATWFAERITGARPIIAGVAGTLAASLVFALLVYLAGWLGLPAPLDHPLVFLSGAFVAGLPYAVVQHVMTRQR